MPARAAKGSNVMYVLDGLELDPASYSARVGRETGSCCFCRKGLTTKASLAAGYGPICASKLGLPWGE